MRNSYVLCKCSYTNLLVNSQTNYYTSANVVLRQLGNKWKHFLSMFPNCRNMPETKRKICVWVSTDMYDNVVNAGYDSPTVAVIKGFELLLGEEERRENAGEIEQVAAQLKASNSNLKMEMEKLNTALKNAPDTDELIELKVRTEELKAHNETLKKELEINQETHRNYMLQMQTLINQKAIEAPGANKPWWRFW